MNANAQAQKSFRTFILTLSVSLLLFSAIYYFVSQRKDITDNTPVDNSGIVEKQESTSLYDYESGPEEAAIEKSTVSDNYSMGAGQPIEDTPRSFDEDPDTSAFGGLAEQKMFIEGQMFTPEEPLDDSVDEDPKPGADNETPVQAVPAELNGTSDASVATPPEADEGPVAVVPFQEESVKATINGDQMEVVSQDNENAVENDSTLLAAVDPSVQEPTTVTETDADSNVAVDEVQDASVPAVAGVFDENTFANKDVEVSAFSDVNVGGPMDGVSEASTETQEAAPVGTPQVLADVDQTTTSPVPETGILSMTVGLVLSFSTFLFALIWIIKGPRRMAMDGFERDLTRDKWSK